MEGETSHDRCCESWVRVRKMKGQSFSIRLYAALLTMRMTSQSLITHQYCMRFLEVCQRWRDSLNVNRDNRTDLGRKEHRGYYDGFLENTHD